MIRNKLSLFFFCLLFIVAIIKNSIWVASTSLEGIISSIQLILVGLIVLISLLAIKKKITLTVYIAIFLCILFCLRVREKEGIEYVQLLALFLMCLATYNQQNIIKSTKIVIWTYFLICTLILLSYLTGLYHYETVTWFERSRVILGFRNINTFSFYCYIIFWVAFILKEKLLVGLSSIIFVWGAIITDTRSPLYATVITLLILVICKFLKKTPLIYHILIYSIFFVITIIGLSEILMINYLFNNGVLNISGDELNILTSYRLEFLFDVTKNYSILDWIFGKALKGDDVQDSLYFNMIGAFGILFFTYIIFHTFYRIKRLSYKFENLNIVMAIISFWILGLVESPITPYNLLAVLLFTIVLFGDINYHQPLIEK